MYNILIVDDVEANLYTLKTILENNFEDVKIFEALDASVGLKIAMDNSIDLIISDIQMPNMDGFEFAKFLRKSAKTKDIPIIFVTAIFDTDEYRQKGFDLGAIDYITKPIDEMLLVSKLKNNINIYKLQKELIEKDKYTQMLLDISDEGQILIDKYTNILDFNISAKKIFDSIRKDITIGKLFKEEEEEIIKLKNFISSVAFDNSATHVFKHKKRYYKITYKNIDINHIVSFYDVTKEIKEAKRTQAIFNSQNSIVVVSNGVNISNINSTFFKTFGYENLKEFQSKHKCICELFVQKDENIPHLMPIMDDIRWNKYINANPQIIHEAYMIDKDGNERIYEVKVSGQIFEEEEVMVFNDITQIKQQTKMLEDQSRFAAMGEMISMIAHQWRQPLTTMTTIFSKMKIMRDMDMLDDKSFDNDFGKINRLAQYMTKTIDEFQNFFKNQATDEEITLEELILKPKRLVDPSLKNHNVEFDINYNISKETILNINSSKFDQVLLNLFKNSMDEFNEKKIANAVISVECSQNNESIILKISDNAGGIPEDIIKKVFDPYFSTKSKNGTGIGLYMSKIIIKEHLGGDIRVSNNTHGACFEIRLPKSIVQGSICLNK